MNKQSPYTILKADINQPDVALQIHAVQIAAYTIESRLIDYPALPPLQESVLDLQQSGERFLGCWLVEQIVGAISWLTTDHTVEICRLAVSPAYTRQGIAKNLLKTLEERTKQMLTGELIIRVATAAKNTPALNLYQQHGYRIIRHHTLPDGLVLVHLQKSYSEIGKIL